jgi:hypothetical protein
MVEDSDHPLFALLIAVRKIPARHAVSSAVVGLPDQQSAPKILTGTIM